MKVINMDDYKSNITRITVGKTYIHKDYGYTAKVIDVNNYDANGKLIDEERVTYLRSTDGKRWNASLQYFREYFLPMEELPKKSLFQVIKDFLKGI